MHNYSAIYNMIKKAISEENTFLRDLFSKRRHGIEHFHQGIWFATEHIYVYIVLKELIKNLLDYKIKWEVQYGKSKKYLDLLLESENGNIAIEFKISDKVRDTRILEDIRKIGSFANIVPCSRIICLISLNEIMEEQLKWIRDETKVSSVTMPAFDTDIALSSENHKQKSISISFLEVN